MNFKKASSKFLTNKFVLYLVSFIAFFNIIGHMMIGNYNLVVYFIIFSFLVKYFSKNMIIVLGVPLVLINMLSVNENYVEGFTENTDKTKKTDPTDTTKKTDPTDTTKKTDPTDTTKKTETTIRDGDTGIDNKALQTVKEKKNENFEIGRSKNNKSSIDYATTIEDAYDNLNSILGKDGIKNLTYDTEKLMQQQAQLAGSLKDMGPMIEKMGPMMEQVNQMMNSMPKKEKEDIMSNVEGLLSTFKKK
jgi:hypothetical protein